MLLAEILYKADIILDIRQHLPAPLLPFPEGSNCSNRSKERRLIQFVGREPRIELAAYLLARNDGITAHDTRNVEGLGRSLEGDANIARMVADRCKRNMLVSEESHVCMNLVADYQQMMFIAEISQSLQGFLVPGNTSRIMRIAENQHLALLVTYLFQIFEIHLVISVLTHLQRIEDHLTAVSLRGETERMINGWLDDDLLIFLGEDVHHQSYSLHDAWNKANPLALHIPLMMSLHPIDDAGQIVFRLYGISEERMFQTCLQGIGDEIRGLEVHIRYPERQQIGSSPAWLQRLVLEVAATRTVNYFIKIVLHTLNSFYFEL